MAILGGAMAQNRTALLTSAARRPSCITLAIVDVKLMGWRIELEYYARFTKRYRSTGVVVEVWEKQARKQYW